MLASMLRYKYLLEKVFLWHFLLNKCIPLLLANKVYKMQLQSTPTKQKSFIKLVTPNLKSRSNDSKPQEEIRLQRENCSNFFYNCMNPRQLKQTQKNTIYEQLRLHKIKEPSSPKFHQPIASMDLHSQSKRKISLSIKKKSSQQFTSNKQAKDTNNKARYLSEKKKIEPKEQKNRLIKLNLENKTLKIKTSPERQKVKTEQNVHQLRQSSKPQIKGQFHSSKKQNDTKSKLTLSSSFKSQMKSSERKQIPQFSIKHNFQKPNPQILSDQVIVEESFMTAKLANIYGDRNSELQLFPNSNIVYYNQLMANEHLWRPLPAFPQSNDVTFYHQTHQYNDKFNKNEYKDISIQKQIPEEFNQKDSEEQINFKFNLKDRKRIGQYAKTIRTFNQSQLRSNDLNSQAESIVLQRGFNQYHNGVSVVAANRGSIKDYEKEESNFMKRGYGSVGEDYNQINVTQGQYKFNRLVSQTIQQDLYDSEINQYKI